MLGFTCFGFLCYPLESVATHSPFSFVAYLGVSVVVGNPRHGVVSFWFPLISPKGVPLTKTTPM